MGLVILLVVIAAIAAAEWYRARDFLPHLIASKQPLAEWTEDPVGVGPDFRITDVRIRGADGLVVTGRVKAPIGDAQLRPALLILGGVRTGRDVITYLGETPGVVALAIDYPYDGKKSGLGTSEVVSALPRMRRAVLKTVPAAMLAVDYLLGRGDVDPERITFVGGSIGALFGPAITAADPRIAGTALLFGAGDLQSLLRANIDAPTPAAAAAAWALSLLVTPVEPVKYIGRVAPRPVFMLNATNDARMPVENSRRLHEAAREPRTIRWLDAGHVNVREREFHDRVRSELVRWLVENQLIDGDTGAAAPPGGHSLMNVPLRNSS